MVQLGRQRRAALHRLNTFRNPHTRSDQHDA
jgi:hypothetical protein